MAMREVTYRIPQKGLATSFTEPEIPIDYLGKLRNRFINAEGGAEKRHGMTLKGDAAPGLITLTGLHELVKKDGTEVLIASGEGRIFSQNESTGAWTQIHQTTSTEPLRSVQMDGKLIFTNGEDPRFFTDDGTTFQDLRALVEKGTTATGSSSTELKDAEIQNWATGTDVVVNDLIHNRTLDAYGLVTEVSASSLNHTEIGPNAEGLGKTSVSAQEAGEKYEILDLVELNIIPTDIGDDNVADAGTGTNTSVIAVSGLTFSDTDIQAGDFVRNTTRSAVVKVGSVSANINVTEVSGQAAADSLVFLKSAMPISDLDHIHFSRSYSIDGRDKRKIRISGANDPTDMTTDAGTIDAASFAFGNQQPQGDTVISMTSFQRFFVIAGKQNVMAWSGTNPIADTSADVVDFAPIGLFPQGCVSPDGLISIGNDAAFVTPDGIQAVSLVDDASELNRANLTEQINKTLRDEIKNTGESEIILIHYPRRSWLMLKVGSLMYVYNYTEFLGDTNQGRLTQEVNRGSISLFDGLYAQQRAYLVRRSGDLLAAGAGGKVYALDDGFSDDGQEITTELQTGWLTLESPRRMTVRQKKLNYIKPIFDAGDASITYTILAEGNFNAENTDTITVPVSGDATPVGIGVIGSMNIGGSSVQNVKHPLRTKGEVIRISITNQHDKGPDIIDRFTLYANLWGRK